MKGRMNGCAPNRRSPVRAEVADRHEARLRSGSEIRGEIAVEGDRDDLVHAALQAGARQHAFEQRAAAGRIPAVAVDVDGRQLHRVAVRIVPPVDIAHCAAPERHFVLDALAVHADGRGQAEKGVDADRIPDRRHGCSIERCPGVAAIDERERRQAVADFRSARRDAGCLHQTIGDESTNPIEGK
jgi:hypothetical protein